MWVLQGPVPDAELDQLLKEATYTCDKAECDYLYKVSKQGTEEKDCSSFMWFKQ